MSLRKEIVSVEPSSSCAESYPCQHTLTIKYKDGTTEETGSNGRDIAKKYFNYLNENNKNHFSVYLSRSGVFGRQPDSNSEQKVTQEKTMSNQKKF